MKLFLPKQHGAWAMLIIPFWLSVVASGFRWQQIPLFMGWLLLYLATFPMLQMVKGKKVSFYRKWTVIYLIPALLLLMIPLWARPSIAVFGLLMLPFFVINVYFSKKKQDRNLWNDFSAILVFAIGGLASGFLPNGEMNSGTILVFITSILFFVGSTFYVKTMIREKKNVTYKWISWIYHAIVPIAFLIIGYWIVAISYIPSLIRAIYFYGKPYTMKQVGILEIVNAALFFIVIVLAIN
ncbi:YwiC-like family protein [Robertmurraya massiliosenegalensis]|uniref:YwiC-like family protein n=1 Tax=Robertmurraya massiliosenegalensis TaxID=1287657 RepID=UPI000318BD9D|nr:YwiC-like family protein [Robertmurraya massiliosenegalensis]